MNLKTQGAILLSDGVADDLFFGRVVEYIFDFSDEKGEYHKTAVRQLPNRRLERVEKLSCKMTVNGQEMFVHFTRDYSTQGMTDNDGWVNYTIEAQLELELVEDTTAPNNLGKDLS